MNCFQMHVNYLLHLATACFASNVLLTLMDLQLEMFYARLQNIK